MEVFMKCSLPTDLRVSPSKTPYYSMVVQCTGTWESISYFVSLLALLVSKLASKVSDILNSAREDSKESGGQSADDDIPLQSQIVSNNGMSQSVQASSPAWLYLHFTFLCVILYSGKVLHGAKFCSFHEQFSCREKSKFYHSALCISQCKAQFCPLAIQCKAQFWSCSSTGANFAPGKISCYTVA